MTERPPSRATVSCRSWRIFDNLLTKFGVSTQTNDTFRIHGVPYYKLYDRKGELRYQFADVYEGPGTGQPVERSTNALPSCSPKPPS